jgi:hypothetical protein
MVAGSPAGWIEAAEEVYSAARLCRGAPPNVIVAKRAVSLRTSVGEITDTREFRE